MDRKHFTPKCHWQLTEAMNPLDGHHPARFKVYRIFWPIARTFYSKYHFSSRRCNKTKPTRNGVVFCFGAPGRIRTYNLLIRSQMLYPIELRAHHRWHDSPFSQKMQVFFCRIVIFSFCSDQLFRNQANDRRLLPRP